MLDIGIVGLGLIGASLGKASTKAGHSVYGTDKNQNAVAVAIKNIILKDLEYLRTWIKM